MSANVYRCDTVSGPVLMRRSVKQGRKPSGLAKPESFRLFADDDKMLRQLRINRNEFVRLAVRKALSVYTELLKS